MPVDLSKLDLIVDNDYIQNLKDIITYLKTMNLDFNSCEYLETLVNKLRYTDIKNKDDLISLIDSKILEFKLQEQELELSNQEALRLLQEHNSDLKKISIIETKKDKNDSGKDIDYIAITHDDGEIEMVVCEGYNTLNNFIKSNSSSTTMSAEEIFKYFKEYIHVNLKFYGIEEIEKLNPEMENQAIVKEDSYKLKELEDLKRYKKQFDLQGDIKLTVDPNGERIYTISDAIIKFCFDGEQNRIMQVLKKPTLNLSNDFLDEANEAYDKTEVFDAQVIQAIRVGAYESTDKTSDIFNIDKLKDILIKRDVYETKLDYEEVKYIEYAIGYLLDSMMSRATSNSLESVEQDVLDDYMEPLINVYNENTEKLSSKDIEFVEKYLEIKEEIRNQGLEPKNRLLELKNDGNHSTGIANIVMLLEIVIIGMMILTFLSLDI